MSIQWYILLIKRKDLEEYALISWYWLVPFLNLVLLVILISLLWRVHKTKCVTGIKRRLLIAFTVIFIPISAFFSWRFADMAIYPQTLMNDQGFIWKGHHYVSDNSFDCDKIPSFSALNKVAYEKRNSLFLDLFFPYTLYEEKNDPGHKTLWELGIMLDEKFDRID